MNIFSVLGDSDDEEQQKTEVKKDAKAKKDAKVTPAAKTDAAAKPASAASKPTDAKKDTKPKDGAAKPKPATGNKPTPAPAAADADQELTKDNNRGGLPRGKDHLKKNETHKGALKEDDGQRKPKREFDRRSGTGRGKELAKDGRGKYGFGNVNQEAQEGEKDPAAAEVAVEQADGADKDANGEAEPAEPAKPEPVTYSLDEYLATRNAARAKAQEIGARQERKVETVFKGLSEKADEGTEEFIKAVKLPSDKNAVIKDQRSTGKTAVADVAFKFNPISDRDRDVRVRTDRPQREDRPRSGGRGGGRGGDRGGDRRSNSGNSNGRGDGNRGGRGGANSVFKAEDFPSL